MLCVVCGELCVGHVLFGVCMSCIVCWFGVCCLLVMCCPCVPIGVSVGCWLSFVVWCLTVDVGRLLLSVVR